MNKELGNNSKQYPHAKNYIFAEALATASKETLETWEYEAELCDRVKAAFKGDECPKCGSKVFMIGDTIIDFNFPFVDGRRIRTRGPRTTKSVKCAACGLRKKMKSESDGKIKHVQGTVGKKKYPKVPIPQSDYIKQCSHVASGEREVYASMQEYGGVTDVCHECFKTYCRRNAIIIGEN